MGYYITRRLFRARNRGFSLIELLVSVSIIMLMSTIAFMSFKGFDKENNVRAARDLAMKELVNIQHLSLTGRPTPLCLSLPLSGKKYATKTCVDPQALPTSTPNNCTLGQTCENFFPGGGYGIAFGYDKNASINYFKYTLFADIDPDGDAGPSLPDGQMQSNEVLFQGENTLANGFFFLTPTTYISKQNYELVNSLPSQIVFTPKNTIVVSNALVSNPNVRIQKIIVRDGVNAISKSIFINLISGLIYSGDAQPGGSATPSGG